MEELKRIKEASSDGDAASGSNNSKKLLTINEIP